jgi:hypothetical protein
MICPPFVWLDCEVLTPFTWNPYLSYILSSLQDARLPTYKLEYFTVFSYSYARQLLQRIVYTCYQSRLSFSSPSWLPYPRYQCRSHHPKPLTGPSVHWGPLRYLRYCKAVLARFSLNLSHVVEKQIHGALLPCRWVKR